MSKRLSSEDWIAAGFRALVRKGPEALKAEAIARELKTTKGSFYWHFKDVAALKLAMIDLWSARAATMIIDELNTLPDPEEKLYALARVVEVPPPEAFGGRKVEAAIRAWGLSDPIVAAGIAAVDNRRITFVADILKEAGKDPSLSTVLYGAYIGLDDLAARDRPNVTDRLEDLIALILR